jgi:hypothetical protein|tara:strand:- start:964 stop:1143 length:180 start_codon:yes stop_codon:yes gene_type:complete
MIVQAMIETINGCKMLVRGNGLTDNEKEILKSMSKEDLEQLTDSNAFELELHRMNFDKG